MLGHRAMVLDDYLGALRRRGWLVLIPLILAPIITVGFSYTIPPQYLSQTLVLVESPKVPDTLVKPVISTELDSRLASMKEQILSRSSLQPIIERYNLYAGKDITPDERIDLARKNIDVRTITSEVSHSSGLPGFFISFKAADPHTAQLVCTDITSLFVGENLRQRSDVAQGTVTFLQSQLADAKRSLDEQDAKLAAFQQQYMGRLPSEEGANTSMLTSLNTQLDAATQALNRMQQDRAFTLSLLNQQLASQPATAITPQGTVAPNLSAAQIDLQKAVSDRADLLTHYTPDYPDVQALDRRIADLRREVARASAVARSSTAGSATRASVTDSAAVQQLRAQLQADDLGIANKKREQEQVSAQINGYQSRLEASPKVEEEYKQLTRDNQTAQQFYDDLLAKLNTASMATDLEKRQEGEQFRVMDAANLPDAPFYPKRVVFLMGGLGLGLLLGLLMVAILEYLDTSMRSELDIQTFMQLQTLGVIGLSRSLPQRKGHGMLFRFFLNRRRSRDPYPTPRAN